ncbi:MAG: AAA family ATPase, partial [Candidatus Limnocylindrus sp.]
AAEGAIDAANILKPPLARGEIQCIGATTLDEYRKHIEKDPALERRFAQVLVAEPTHEETLEILKGLRPRYEAHHRVQITDAALAAAIELSVRYINDRQLPDKAIDVMDEAASRVMLRHVSPPAELRAARRQLDGLQRDRARAVASQDARGETALGARAGIIEEQIKVLDAAWRASLRDAAKPDPAPEDVSAEGGERIIALPASSAPAAPQEDVRPVVTDEEVATVVSMWTGVPVMRIAEAETVRLLTMERVLGERVVGQEQAISMLSKAVRRARAGLKDPKRPIGSFLFLGPTGVGKTELAKALAEFMFGSEDALIKIDMSEFMERHNTSRLVGAPPGYVGFDDGGQLTEAIRRRPYAVVLLDEIEKAHAEVFNILLQILEDGQLTDAKGRRVDFRNVILIMTSNLG